MTKNEILENGASTYITWWIYTIKNKIASIIYWKLLGKEKNKMKLRIQKTISTITNHLTKDITHGNDLFDIFLTKHETNILKPGVSVTPTPKYNISGLENDIYNFIRKL